MTEASTSHDRGDAPARVPGLALTYPEHALHA